MSKIHVRMPSASLYLYFQYILYALNQQSSVLGKELVASLKKLCSSKKDKGDLGFNSAICLGCMGLRAPVAKLKLMSCLESQDTELVMRVSVSTSLLLP